MGLGNLQRLHTYFLKQIPKKLALCTDNFGCYTVEHYILIQTEGCKTIRFKESIPNKIEQIRKIEKVRCGILFLFFQFCNFFCIFLKTFWKDPFLNRSRWQEQNKSWQAQYIYIKTVNSEYLLSALLNWLKLVYGTFWHSNMHRTLNFFLDQSERNQMYQN